MVKKKNIDLEEEAPVNATPTTPKEANPKEKLQTIIDGFPDNEDIQLGYVDAANEFNRIRNQLQALLLCL